MMKNLAEIAFVLWLSTVTVLLSPGVFAWTGEVKGRVVCDLCGDSSIGPEDHFLEGAEVAVLCITKSGKFLTTKPSQTREGYIRWLRRCLRVSGGFLAWQGQSTASMTTAPCVGMVAHQ